MRFKSQVDAPIELVIGVIILVASLTIAFSILRDVQSAQCGSQLKTEIQKLQLAMHDLALQSPPSQRKVFLTMPVCGQDSVDVVRFVYFSDPRFCRACPGQVGGCWRLDVATYLPDAQGGAFTSGTKALSEASICVDMPGNIAVVDEHSNNPGVCTELSSSPCPLFNPFGEAVRGCDSSISGVPSAVYSGRTEDPSRWTTLGRLPGVRQYEITLKKTLLLSGKGETGALSVCAHPLKK